MRNYYATLGTDRIASVFELGRLLQELEKLEPELSAKINYVLLDTTRKEIYDKVHLQFEAIALAYEEFAALDWRDTNEWDRRLVEFVPPSVDDDTAFSTLDHSTI